MPLSQIHCQLCCLFCCAFSFSVSHPKALRRLRRRRSPWPWPMMVTWICNQAAIPHRKNTLGLGQTLDCVQIVGNHVRHIPLITVLFEPSDFLLKCQPRRKNRVSGQMVKVTCESLLKGDVAHNYGGSHLSTKERKTRADKRTENKRTSSFFFSFFFNCNMDTVEALFVIHRICGLLKHNEKWVHGCRLGSSRGAPGYLSSNLVVGETKHLESGVTHDIQRTMEHWHLTLSHQCWIFVKENVTSLLGKQPFFEFLRINKMFYALC